MLWKWEDKELEDSEKQDKITFESASKLGESPVDERYLDQVGNGGDKTDKTWSKDLDQNHQQTEPKQDDDDWMQMDDESRADASKGKKKKASKKKK